jgi:hypothetical protein
MALVLNDRVKETSTTSGTGTINLAGAVTNFETFVAGIGNSNTVYYAIVHQDQPEFEVGIGTVTDASPDTLSRTTVLSSSNSDGLVSFSSGTKDVFCTLPASKAVFENASNEVGISSLNIVDGSSINGTITSSSNSLTLNGRNSGILILQTGSSERARLNSDALTLTAPKIAHASNLTIDTGGEITLDASDGIIRLKDDGTEFGKISQNSNNLRFFSTISDADILFQGNDGGSSITALTLDMSAAGKATFNSSVFIGNHLYLGDSKKAIFGAGEDLNIYHDGSNSFIQNDTGILNIKNDDIRFKTSGDETSLRAVANGAVEIMHNNSTKITTTSTGVDVTGTVTADGLTVDGSATFTTADNNPQLTLISTDADANVGPVLNLYRNSASPADGDVLGRILFKGEDDAGNDATFARIETIATDVSNGSENAKMEFYVAINDTFNPSLTLEDTGAATFNSSVTAGSFLQANGHISTGSNSGRLRAGLLNQIELSHNGTHGELDVDTGNLTLDVAGQIKLDADGGFITFEDGGTQFGYIENSSTDLVLGANTQDKDIIFKGNDGGSTITALTLDMSAGGKAVFASNIDFGDGHFIGNDGDDNLYIASSAGEKIRLDSPDEIILDADGGNITLTDGGTAIGQFQLNDTNHLKLGSKVSDADIRFFGNDGGSTITALILDMSEAGTATFNNGVVVQGDLTVQGTTTTLNTATLDVEDKNITVNFGSGDTSGSANGAGITIQDAVDANTDATILWDASNDEFDFSHTANVTGGVVAQTKLAVGVSAVHGSYGLYNQNNAYFNGGVTIDDNLAITAGSISITGDGSNATTLTESGSGDFTVDTVGNIVLNADGGGIQFYDGSDYIGSFGNSSSNFSIMSRTNDKDIVFKGIDGGSTITALTLDMSQAGAATFNAGATFGGGVTVNSGHVNIDAGLSYQWGDSHERIEQSDGNIEFFTNNSQSMTLSGSNLGIGTTSPNSPLEVTKSVTFNSIDTFGQFAIKTASGATGDMLNFGVDGADSLAFLQAHEKGTDFIPLVLQRYGGKVGIGTDSPVSIFHTRTSESTSNHNSGGGFSLTSSSTASSRNARVFLDADNGNFSTSSDGAYAYLEKIGGGGALNIINQDTADINLMHGANVRLKINTSGQIEGDIVNGHTTENTVANDDVIAFYDTSASAMRKTAISNLPGGGGSVAADDITTGDAAVTLGTSSGDITLDTPGDIILDADGDNVYFKAGGGNQASFSFINSDVYLGVETQDKDLIIRGNDGGSTIVALTLDMSDAGTATFNHDVKLGDDSILKIGTDGDLQLTHNNSNGTISNSTGNLLLDVAGDIILDADGGDIKFQDAGTDIFSIINNSSDAKLKIAVQDKDLQFEGNDGGSVFTALTLDMSEGGSATFNKDILLSDNSALRLGTGQDLALFHDGTDSTIRNTTGNLILDVAGDITLDADGENIKFSDAGTEVGQIDLGSQNFTFRSQVDDKDIIFRGQDGTSEIVALTLDMSEAGAATFNNNVTAFSDERLKDNIETLEDGLDKVEQLRGVTYTRDDREEIGVIAQEVEKILPEIVLTANDEMGTKSVDYSRITAVLIEAVKELSARVKELESK